MGKHQEHLLSDQASPNGSQENKPHVYVVLFPKRFLSHAYLMYLVKILKSLTVGSKAKDNVDSLENVKNQKKRNISSNLINPIFC